MRRALRWPAICTLRASLGENRSRGGKFAAGNQAHQAWIVVRCQTDEMPAFSSGLSEIECRLQLANLEIRMAAAQRHVVLVAAPESNVPAGVERRP